ncbi:hypothetical protein BHM03_00045601 [Ensete ventricosum]|nr:hypothetical protein BHM03_00045601 [Ensete ventricosum]
MRRNSLVSKFVRLCTTSSSILMLLGGTKPLSNLSWSPQMGTGRREVRSWSHTGKEAMSGFRSMVGSLSYLKT